MRAWYALLISHIANLLVHLTGLVVATILSLRSRSRAAVLAVAGFGLLTLIAITQILLGLPPVSRELVRVDWLIWVLNCCCSIVELAAMTCLIIAIWQAISGGGGAEKATQESAYTGRDWEEADEALQEIVEAGDEVPEGTIHSAVKPEEAEEAVYTELSPESPYVTRVLDETMEEGTELSGEDVEEHG